MESIILSFILSLYAILPKSQALHRKFTSLTSVARPVFVQPLSLTPFDSSPSRGASGETVHFAGTAKASPLGRGVTEGDGEGKPGTKEPLRSDGQALCQSDTIAVSELFGSGLALSVGLAPASSPCRGASGEEADFSDMPRPPLDRGGGIASAMTERFTVSV